MFHKPILFCLLLLFPAIIFAQSLSYSTYTIKDGLAGNQVYSIIQDNEGFIWFGTETGVSRFDGSTFRNYTIRDGLPDNAIIRVFPDSRGRVWLIPFNKSVCYFYKGKIYNQKNDPLLKDIIFKYSITNITETPNGSIILFGYREILELKPNGKFITHPFPGDETYVFAKTSQFLNGPDLFFAIANNIYKFSNGNIQFVKHAALNNTEYLNFSNTLNYWTSIKLDSLHLELPRENLQYKIPFPSINNINAINDSIVAINTIKGTFIFNLITRQTQRQLMPDHSITNWFKDSEGNNWLASANGGVIRIHSENFRSFSTLPNNSPLSIYSMYKDKNKILLGSDRKIWQLNGNMTLTPFEFPGSFNKTVSFITQNEGKYYFGAGFFLYSGSPEQGFNSTNLYSAAKNIAFKKDGTPFVSTSYGLMRMTHLPDIHHLLYFRSRTTTVSMVNDTCWFGSMNGLYTLKNDTTLQWMGSLC
ncbi:MAG: hypothetical protein J7502_19735, partial [Flavisolibacter sp.]|nr:hypothetical protein [Flavisolibacter sp.]